MNRPHPLDQLIKDDSIFFLEAMIPFVDYAYKKPLILLIKYHEIRALMQCFDNHAYITECGFDCHPKSQEEMMECLCRFLPGDMAGNLKNMQQMMKMMQVMQFMNDAEPADKTRDRSQTQSPGKSQDRNQGHEQEQNQSRKPSFEEIARTFGSGQTWNNTDEHPSSPPDTPPGPPPDKNLYDSVMSILNEG